MLPEIVFIAMAWTAMWTIIGGAIGYSLKPTYTSILLVSVGSFVGSLFFADIVLNGIFTEAVKNICVV